MCPRYRPLRRSSWHQREAGVVEERIRGPRYLDLEQREAARAIELAQLEAVVADSVWVDLRSDALHREAGLRGQLLVGQVRGSQRMAAAAAVDHRIGAGVVEERLAQPHALLSGLPLSHPGS